MKSAISYFPGKRKEEKIVLVLRRHWLIFFKHFFASFLLAFIPVAGYFLIHRFTQHFSNNQYFPLVVLLVSAYYMFVLVYFYMGILDYYLDVWIVTNERIINVVQNGMFKRIVAEQNIYRVQDVTAEVNGMIETFFRFGTVSVQTAGTRHRFEFEQVPNPYKVKRYIMKLHDIRVNQEDKKYTSRITDRMDASNNVRNLNPSRDLDPDYNHLSDRPTHPPKQS